MSEEILAMSPWASNPLVASMLEEEARHIDKSIRLYTKNNWFCRLLSVLLFWLPKGKFLKETITAIGHCIFIPEEWMVRQVQRKLPHEGRHTKQFRWAGLGIHPLVGVIPLGIIYFLFPLPVFFALGRFLLELDADKAEWRDHLRKQGAADEEWILLHAKNRGRTLSEGLYFWALIPKKLSVCLYNRAAQKIIEEYKNETKLG